jgi:hypothetical protein
MNAPVNANLFSGLFEMQVEGVVLGPVVFFQKHRRSKMRQEAHAPA